MLNTLEIEAKKTVALSSTEAKFVAACEGVRDSLFVRNLIDIISDRKLPANVYIDNIATMEVITKFYQHQGMEHIGINCCLIHQKFIQC